MFQRVSEFSIKVKRTQIRPISRTKQVTREETREQKSARAMFVSRPYDLLSLIGRTVGIGSLLELKMETSSNMSADDLDSVSAFVRSVMGCEDDITPQVVDPFQSVEGQEEASSTTSIRDNKNDHEANGGNSNIFRVLVPDGHQDEEEGEVNSTAETVITRTKRRMKVADGKHLLR